MPYLESMTENDSLTISVNADAASKKKHHKSKKAPHTKVVSSKQSVTDIDCLTAAIYIEARGESDKGKLAVANVIKNRVKRQNETMCAVLSKPGQFQGFSIGRVLSLKQKDGDDWKVCRQIALASIKSSSDPTNGAVRFQHKSIAPPKRYVVTARIGDHIFMKERDRLGS